MNNVTVVTALFNIDRETKGDQRKWSDYLQWFRDTLQLQIPMVIFVREDLKSFIEEHRPSTYKTTIITENIPYSYFEAQITAILNNQTYKNKIRCPNRVECILPYYNIIQYSKFKWLKHAIEKNYFGSEYFFWMDAGISRFIDVTSRVVDRIILPQNKLCIQKNTLFDYYEVSENYIWDSQCLLCGTVFGGDAHVLLTIGRIVDELLHYWINQLHFVNNEQIMLAYIAKLINPELFHLVLNNTNNHICLFQQLFIAS